MKPGFHYIIHYIYFFVLVGIPNIHVACFIHYKISPEVLFILACVHVCVLQESGPNLSFDDAGRKCRKLVSKVEDFTSIQLVYGNAGDGKTHYIRQQLVQSPAKLTIAVNEAFSPLAAIKKLRSLPSNAKDCAIFFNFAMMSYQVRREHCSHLSTAYHTLLHYSLNCTVMWILVLRYLFMPGC